MYEIRPQNKCSFSLSVCLSLSPMRYTQVSVCVKWGTHILYLYFPSLEFFPNKSAPTNLLGRLHLGRTQNNIILYSGGFYWPNLQWMFYLMTLWWPNIIVTPHWRNNKISLGLHQRNTFRISFEVTIFQQVWGGERRRSGEINYATIFHWIMCLNKKKLIAFISLNLNHFTSP